MFIQKRCDGTVARCFVKRLLRKHQGQARKIVADKLRSYGGIYREANPF
ncbi:MAG: hypothetical protein ACKVIB_01310 [Pseudomonadales bacterium]